PDPNPRSSPLSFAPLPPSDTAVPAPFPTPSTPPRPTAHPLPLFSTDSENVPTAIPPSTSRKTPRPTRKYPPGDPRSPDAPPAPAPYNAPSPPPALPPSNSPSALFRPIARFRNPPLSPGPPYRSKYSPA